MNHFISYYISPIGKLKIVQEGEFITELSFLQESYLLQDRNLSSSPLIQKTKQQLAEYFSQKRTCFDIPLSPKGSSFQQNVWKALINIPYGETRSYQDIAKAVDCPKGARAIGLANHKNPIAILIPCHRVIGSNGKLIGYAGGLDIKEALLKLEGILQ